MSTTIKSPLIIKTTHESEIQIRMSKIEITNALIEDTSIKTNIQIVANTYLNISFDKLSELGWKQEVLLDEGIRKTINFYKYDDHKKIE